MREMRKTAGLTQAELAELAGLAVRIIVLDDIVVIGRVILACRRTAKERDDEDRPEQPPDRAGSH